MTGAAACVRCGRSESDHLLRDQDDFDDLQRRIWKALGFPCAQFTAELAAIFAGNQEATSRWARQPGQRPARDPDTYSRGAALARQALAHSRGTR